MSSSSESKSLGVNQEGPTARTEAPAPNPILANETVAAFKALDEAINDARIYGEFYMSQSPEMAERRRAKVGTYLDAIEFLRAEIERLYYMEAGF